MSGQPLFSGGSPAVEVTLIGGPTYRLTFASSAWMQDDVISAVAYRSPEEKTPRLVTIPYSTITRVEVFEPERKEEMGFRIEREEQAKPLTATSSATSARG